MRIGELDTFIEYRMGRSPTHNNNNRGLRSMKMDGIHKAYSGGR